MVRRAFAQENQTKGVRRALDFLAQAQAFRAGQLFPIGTPDNLGNFELHAFGHRQRITGQQLRSANGRTVDGRQVRFLYFQNSGFDVGLSLCPGSQGGGKGQRYVHGATPGER